MRRYPIADRETGARKRLAVIMARYPHLTAYVQGDPRGCALYILTASQLSACDCEASGNTNKPKQHAADPHAKNCRAYTHSIDLTYDRGVAVA